MTHLRLTDNCFNIIRPYIYKLIGHVCLKLGSSILFKKTRLKPLISRGFVLFLQFAQLIMTEQSGSFVRHLDCFSEIVGHSYLVSVIEDFFFNRDQTKCP